MRIRQLNLRDAVALVPYTAGAAALTSAGLSTIKAARAPSFPYAGVVDGLAAAALVAAAVLSWWVRRRAKIAPPWMDDRGDRVDARTAARDTMMINEVREARVVERIRTHSDDYECLIGDSLESPEARAFLAVQPGAQRLERPFGTVPIYVLLARPAI